jgi:hypothetical protein
MFRRPHKSCLKNRRVNDPPRQSMAYPVGHQFDLEMQGTRSNGWIRNSITSPEIPTSFDTRTN